MPSFLIKVDFDWDFAFNKYSLRAYFTHSLQPTILNDNVNQVGLETDKGHFTLKVKTVTFLLPIVHHIFFRGSSFLLAILMLPRQSKCQNFSLHTSNIMIYTVRGKSNATIR
jgi:hypothetical protein